MNVRSLKELMFYCPRCNKPIPPSALSVVVRNFIEGKIDRETALKVCKQNHYRHEHTAYDESLRSYLKQIGLSEEETLALKLGDRVKARLWLFILAQASCARKLLERPSMGIPLDYAKMRLKDVEK